MIDGSTVPCPVDGRSHLPDDRCLGAGLGVAHTVVRENPPLLVR
jgi:hypothetical protein